MKEQWKLSRQHGIAPFTATFPEQSLEGDIPSHVKISSGATFAYFKLEVRPHAGGDQVFVSQNSLQGIADQASLTVKGSPAKRYHLHRVVHDATLKLALVGLLFTVASLFINASLAVGKDRPVIILSAGCLSALMWSACILQVFGAVCLFWKGVREAK